MKPSGQFTEPCKNIYDEAFKASWLEGIEQGIASLDRAFSSNEVDKCSLEEQNFLHELRLAWSRVIDNDYKPPQPHLPSEVDPFILKSFILATKGDSAGSLYNAWLALQYQPTGTERLSETLISLIEVSVILREYQLARAAAEMLISNIELMRSISIYTSPRNVHMRYSFAASKESSSTKISDLPWREAIEVIGIEPASCWEKILIMAVDIATDSEKQQKSYQEIVEALREYYVGSREISKLNFVTAYELSE